jgi:hypothetical protein
LDEGEQPPEPMKRRTCPPIRYIGCVLFTDCYFSTQIKPSEFINDEYPTQKYKAPREYIDYVCRTTYFHDDSATSNKKLSVSSSESELLFAFTTTEYTGLCHCNITANTPDTRGCIIHHYINGYIFMAQWVYFLRLSGFILFGSRYIFSNSVDLLFSA